MKTVNSFVIGVGLTDRCNSECPHCYSRPQGEHTDLDFRHLQKLAHSIPIASINFGTGESILHPEFRKILHFIYKSGIPVSLTTNGYTVECLKDEDLWLFHDLDFSLDFPDEMMNDRWRGAGSMLRVLRGIDRCKRLGVEASLVTCLMKENADFMSGLAELAKAHEVNLRINIYKPVFGKNHCPDFGQFWSAIRKLMQNLALISCSEPIVNAAIGNVRANEGAPCGHSSFRIQPEGGIVPCVYLRNGKIKINNLIEDPIETHRRLINAMELPLLEICKECDRVQICQGGCKARRMLSEKPAEPDGYCFVQRNFEPNLKANWKESKGLVHENYLCTMIFSK